MADNTKYFDTSKLEMKDMGQAIDNMMTTAQNSRRNFEKRWYDNNFFDDGHHFRYLSRQQNKIVDLSDKASLYSPMRSIPKASRQIRGVANLITSQDYTPIVYPEKVEKANYDNPEEFMKAMQEAKMVAKKSGHWLEEEFKVQQIKEKLSLMTILSGKNYVSYLQVMPDAEKEKLITVVRDAFDIYLMGEVDELEDSPYLILAHPKVLSEIKANEMFDQEQRDKINPDNRQANSEIKEAYMKGKFGREFNDDSSATVILKEAYVREHLCAANFGRIRKQKNAQDILTDKKEGDIIYRQSFTAGNIELYDQYVDIPSYPVVDLRLEPGPMYGVSMIERFIPSNKSLDVILSRIERYTNSQPLGVIAKRAGESYKISNVAGGQVVEYKTQPPIFQNQQSLPPSIFEYVNLLNSFIEEQGVSTSTLGQLPSGVKAAKAIESLKESEFANLVIAQRQFKNTVKRIAEKFLDYADKYFVTPQTTMYLEKGEPTYFDIVGKRAMDKRAELKVPVNEEVVPISRDYRVDIEVQSGMAYTHEGKKAAAKELGDFMLQLSIQGMIPPAAMSKFLEVFLESYQFGPTGDVMQDMEEYLKEGQVSDPQMEKIKLAVAEVLKDAGVVGPDAEEKLIQTTKIGAVEALKDTGLIDKDNTGGLEEEKVKQEMAIKREEADVKITNMDDKAKLEEEKARQEIRLKEEEAAQDAAIKRAIAEAKIRLAEKQAAAKAKEPKKEAKK